VFEVVCDARCEEEGVGVFAGEADVGEEVEHSEEGGGSRSACGEDEEVAAIAGGAEGGVVAFCGGGWAPCFGVGVGIVEGVPGGGMGGRGGVCGVG